jgi:Flp pilus assembly protein TadD
MIKRETSERQDKGIKRYDPSAELVSPGKLSLANNSLIHIVSLIVLILIVYGNTFNAPFQWDESEFIIRNPFITDFPYITNPSGSKELLTLHGDFINRYVGYLTFALDYKIHGSSVTGYHVVNIAIHIANALLVYMLVLLIFRTPTMADSSLKQQSRYIALFSSLLFAAHPIQIEAVTYIFQRLASLAALFYFLSLTMYIKSRISQNKKRRILSYSIALFSSVLAMKTKENAFTLPLVIALFEFCFFKDSMKKRLIFLAPILLTLAIIPLTLLGITGSTSHPPSYMSSVVPSRSEYFLTQFRVIVTYLRLLLFPVNQNLFYDYPAFKSFLDPQVFLSFLLLMLLFALGVYLVKIKDWNHSISSPRFTDLSALRLAGFGIIWFFIALSVESSIIPLPMPICEYRMYLPSVGLIIGIITVTFLLKEHFKIKLAFILVPFVIAIAVLSYATHARNELWNDNISLWEDIVQKSPRSALAHYNLGTMYSSNGLLDKAIEQYQIVLTMMPNHTGAYDKLGISYASQGQFDKAIEQFQAALRLKPDYAEAYYNLALAYSSKGQFDLAIEQFKKALRLKPDYAEAYDDLGVAYARKGLFGLATENYQAALRLKPDFALAHFNLGVIYLNKGLKDLARREFEAGLASQPDNYEARQILNSIVSQQ